MMNTRTFLVGKPRKHFVLSFCAILLFCFGLTVGMLMWATGMPAQQTSFVTGCNLFIHFLKWHASLYGCLPPCGQFEYSKNRFATWTYRISEGYCLLSFRATDSSNAVRTVIIDCPNTHTSEKSGYVHSNRNYLGIMDILVDSSKQSMARSEDFASKLNQTMDHLLSRDDALPGYAAAMEALYRDKTQDDILRGFAVQHFPLHAETLARRGQFDSATPEATRVRETLFEAARETSTSVGGTALLALERLSHTDSSVDCDALAALVLRTAADDSAAPATRLAAIQLCGTLRLPAAAPYLRTLSADDSANTALRLAARHSLSAIEAATMPP